MQACSNRRSSCKVMHADLRNISLCSQAMVANNKRKEKKRKEKKRKEKKRKEKKRKGKERKEKERKD